MADPTELSRLIALAQTNPDLARKLLAKIDTTLVKPHDGGQREVYDCDARFQVLDAGRRWGKTKIGAAKAVREARKEGQMVWWVAPTYKVVKRGYAAVLKQLPKEMLSEPAPSERSFDAGRSVVLRLKNGSRMEFYSAERPEGMLGEGVDYVVLDEAARLNRDVWEETVRPTLMDREGKALMISTPRGRNWFYYAFIRGQKEEGGYKSWRFPSWTNPHLPATEVETMKAELPALVYQQEVEADFLAAASSVFKWPDEARQDALAKPSGHVMLGIDLAKSTDFTVLMGGNLENRRNCYFERFNDISWKEQRARIKRAERQLRREGAESVTMVMDSTGVGDPIVEDMEEAGYDVIGLNFTTHKANMVTLLAKDLEDGHAYVLGDFIEEMENYTMSFTKTGKFTYSAPAGQHDDVVSAKLLQHWGMVNEGMPNVVNISGEAVSHASDEPGSSYDEGPEEDDWSDLIDGDVAEGAARETVLMPDSMEDIMAREDAWL